MDKLRAMELFVRLADLGSFTRLSEQTNFSKSMISKEISRLEADLGARLLHRTTRNLKLTHTGEGYLQRSREILLKLEEADGFVHELQDKPKGRLKINAPMALAITDLSCLFADYMEAFPEIDLDIHLGDERIDLVEQGFDLGFRVTGFPIESNYIGKPLIHFKYRICVGKNYFDNKPEIKFASDLKAHNCFVYGYFQGRNVWPLEGGVAVTGSLKVNSTIFMLEPIKRGLGIGFVPSFVCQDEIDKGNIIEILPEIEKPDLTLYALYPARHFVPSKIVQCIEYFERWFAQRY